MLTTTLFPGRYIQGPYAIKKLGEEVKRYGDHGFIIADPLVHDEILPDYLSDIEKEAMIDKESFQGECPGRCRRDLWRAV